MNSGILLRIVGPMGALSLALLAVGFLAARNVEEQQQISSELIQKEVNGMLVIEELFIAMRDIRYELNLFLRSHDNRHLENVRSYLSRAKSSLLIARHSARTPEESLRIQVVVDGFQSFVDQFETLAALPMSSETDSRLTVLNDAFLTEEIMKPIEECIGYNKLVVERTTEAARMTAKQLRSGFLLLGTTGCFAGLLVGLGIARALSRSIVQLDVSVRSVAGKLHGVSRPVQISRLGDLVGLESGLRQLEDEIASIVERLQQREMEILRSEQLATVGQLAAGMAHELRNPLMPVKVLVQATLEKKEGVGLSGRNLEIVNEEICRLENSIQAFLDFARPPNVEPVQTDLSKLISGTVDLLSSQAQRTGVRISLDLPAGLVLVFVDPIQIRQVLLNLLLNSLDELRQGGDIEISLKEVFPESPSADAISLQDVVRMATSHPDRVLITVADSGAGFPEAMIDRAFEPFHSTKETGTGLGLSICHRIVTAHQGTITVERRKEGGTMFRILLPCEMSNRETVPIKESA